MMNIIALWMVFSTLAAAHVLFPEYSPIVKTSGGEQQQSLERAKGLATESLHYAVEAARQTGEGIRQTVISASHIPAKTADAVKHVGGDVAQVVKDGSQSGLEKIGLARSEDKSYIEIIKDEAGSAYNAAGDTVETAQDKVRQAARGMQDGAVDMGEWVQGGVEDAYRKVEDGGSAAKGRVCSTAGRAQGVALVGEKGSQIVHSVEDRFIAAEGKALEAVGSVYVNTADCLKASAEAAKECTSSYREKIKHASEQAADIVKSRVAEAVSFLPNIGQGLAYKTHDIHEATTAGGLINDVGERIDVEGKKEDVRSEVNDYAKGLKHATGSYHNDAKEKASEAHETPCETKDFAVDGATDNAGKISDMTYSAKQEIGHQLNDRFVDTRNNLTQGAADGAGSLKSQTDIVVKKLKWITATYFFGSCRAAHLFTFSSVYGSSLWVTFLSGFLLSRAMPRQQFGFVQSRIFPAYLRVAASGHAICLILFLILHPWSKADRDEKLQHLDLWAVLVSTLANVFFLEPRATKAMFQKLKMEKEEGKGEDSVAGSKDDHSKVRLATIDNKFAAFHGYSSVANLLSLLGMTWHLWHLSRRLGI